MIWNGGGIFSHWLKLFFVAEVFSNVLGKLFERIIHTSHCSFPKMSGTHLKKRRVCDQRAQDDSGRPGPGLGRICAVWELRRDVEPLSRGAAAASRCETSVREEL